MSTDNKPSKPYKGPNGIWLTKSLFWDTWIHTAHSQRACDPVFTLHEDKPGLINARKTFVELGDPTGYKWAMLYLGDWNHFLKLMGVPWFKEAYDLWIAELNVKLKSEAIAKIREIANDEESKSSLPAARFLAELDTRTNSKRGRPSKAETDAAVKNHLKTLEVEDEDLQRMGLKVINGGKSGPK